MAWDLFANGTYIGKVTDVELTVGEEVKMAKVVFTLDGAERQVLNSASDRAFITQRIVSYAHSHGHNLRGKPFTYNKHTGEVTYADTLVAATVEDKVQD